MDGPAVGGHPPLLLGLPFFVLAGQIGDPALPPFSMEIALTGIEKLSKHGLGVSDNANIRVPVAADLRGIDVDLDQLCVGVPARWPCVADDVVLAGANQYDKIGLSPAGAAGTQEGKRMVLGNGAAALGSGVKWEARPLHEGAELFLRLSPKHPAAADEDRPLGPGDEVKGALHEMGLPRRPPALRTGRRPADLIVAHGAVEDVPRLVH